MKVRCGSQSDSFFANGRAPIPIFVPLTLVSVLLKLNFSTSFVTDNSNRSRLWFEFSYFEYCVLLCL